MRNLSNCPRDGSETMGLEMQKRRKKITSLVGMANDRVALASGRRIFPAMSYIYIPRRCFSSNILALLASEVTLIQTHINCCKICEIRSLLLSSLSSSSFFFFYFCVFFKQLLIFSFLEPSGGLFDLHIALYTQRLRVAFLCTLRLMHLYPSSIIFFFYSISTLILYPKLE